jgi:hypothetical protein
MLIKYKLEQIKKNETGESCSMDGGQDSCIQGLVGKPERDRLEDPGIGGKIILKCIFRVGLGGGHVLA